MVVGMLWYSPMLFGKEWSKITGVTDKVMKAKRNAVMPVLVLISLVTAYALSLFIVYFHYFSGCSWFVSGIDTSLIAGVGFGATAVFAHGVFEPRDTKLLYINAGNRIVTLLIMGMIIAAFLK
jgi:hypothetical protein